MSSLIFAVRPAKIAFNADARPPVSLADLFRSETDRSSQEFEFELSSLKVHFHELPSFEISVDACRIMLYHHTQDKTSFPPVITACSEKGPVAAKGQLGNDT